MIGLLASLPQSDYPVDYLLARLPARQAHWRERFAPCRQDEALAGWAAMAQEFRWLYGQLNRRLRQELAPFFVYCALRPLFLFLRDLASGREEPGQRLLVATLLADDLKRALLDARRVEVALRQLNRYWPPDPALERLYEAGGLPAVEQRMTHDLLVTAAYGSAVLRPFWAAVIDLENITALAKRLRWRAARPLVYRDGGLLSVRRLAAAERLAAPELLPAVAAPIARAVQEGNWPLEELLVERVANHTRRSASGAPAAMVASYLWGAYAATRRLALAEAIKAIP